MHSRKTSILQLLVYFFFLYPHYYLILGGVLSAVKLRPYHGVLITSNLPSIVIDFQQCFTALSVAPPLMECLGNIITRYVKRF